MASLAAYIDEKKYEELETFFYEHILPMQNNLTQKNGTLNNLSNVNILELKSILYTKLLLAVNQDIVFIISNSFIDMGLSVDQMHKKEVTTKGAGHGIGLYNVSEILNRYDNIYHETLIKEGLFIQQVQIS